MITIHNQEIRDLTQKCGYIYKLQDGIYFN